MVMIIFMQPSFLLFIIMTRITVILLYIAFCQLLLHHSLTSTWHLILLLYRLQNQVRSIFIHSFLIDLLEYLCSAIIDSFYKRSQQSRELRWQILMLLISFHFSNNFLIFIGKFSFDDSFGHIEYMILKGLYQSHKQIIIISLILASGESTIDRHFVFFCEDNLYDYIYWVIFGSLSQLEYCILAQIYVWCQMEVILFSRELLRKFYFIFYLFIFKMYQDIEFSGNQLFGFLAGVCPASPMTTSGAPSPKGLNTQIDHSDPSAKLTTWNQMNLPATTCSNTFTILYSGVPSWPSLAANPAAHKVAISLCSMVIYCSWNPPANIRYL